jgi:hypothetical protein
MPKRKAACNKHGNLAGRSRKRTNREYEQSNAGGHEAKNTGSFLHTSYPVA